LNSFTYSFSFTGVVGRICITSSPLNVNEIALTNFQIIWSEVILDCRVSLDDVATFTTNVEIENTTNRRNSRRTRSDCEYMRTILRRRKRKRKNIITEQQLFPIKKMKQRIVIV
jgi:hypothetical protein